MKSDSDAAKLDELKRLLRRLDKALPQSPGPETQALVVPSQPVPTSVPKQGNGAALRTIVLASIVSLIVSFAVALLIFHDTPVRRLIAAKAPTDITWSLVLRDDPPKQSTSLADTATVMEPTSELKVEAEVAQSTKSGVGIAATPSSPGDPSATVSEASMSHPRMETGGVAETTSSIAAKPDQTTPSEETPSATGPATTSPSVQTDNAAQPEARRSAMVELDATQFMSRGMTMLNRGNVGAAQLLLERAADLGSGDAAYTLAGTYDGAPGAPRNESEVRPNAELAIRWYARAEELGIEGARKRLAELKNGNRLP